MLHLGKTKKHTAEHLQTECCQGSCRRPTFSGQRWGKVSFTRARRSGRQPTYIAIHFFKDTANCAIAYIRVLVHLCSDISLMHETIRMGLGAFKAR